MAIASSSDVRSPTLAFMVGSYAKSDAAAAPLRLVTRIPGSYTIVAECLLLIDTQHPAGSQTWLSLRAAFAFAFAFAFAYGISPRPGEYLPKSGKIRKVFNMNGNFLESESNYSFPLGLSGVTKASSII